MGTHQDGDHGQAAVLDLLNLELLQRLGVVGQRQRVEGAARVQRVQAIEHVRVELAAALARGVAWRAALCAPAGCVNSSRVRWAAERGDSADFRVCSSSGA